MKSISRFLMFALALISVGAHASPVATTAGSNLTAYNPGFGATNNNNWNMLTNPRGGADAAPSADFGNCNALILRCAQPKCASGGCSDMDVTRAIVSGCVNSNDTCKQYGAELIDYISAQMVAQSAAHANQAAAAAAEQAANQSNQQMQAMQQQMAALQQQIADSNASMQAALDAATAAQQQSNATAVASAPTDTSSGDGGGGLMSSLSSSSDSTELTAAQRVAIESGVKEELVLREQISGEILTYIENAEKSLETLEQTMTDAFDYAGCDSRGSNCTGPKRVKRFKEKAKEFFDPYNDVLDDLYEAILLAQGVGVDVSNIYMLLNNSCERWGKYACARPMTYIDPTGKGDVNDYMYVWPRYDEVNCDKSTGKSRPGQPISAALGKYKTLGASSYSLGSVRGGMECNIGQIIPPEDDTSCTMISVISSVTDEGDAVARGYLYPDQGDMGDIIRVGCASNALKGSWLFRGRKNQAQIDIEILGRIIDQDNAMVGFSSRANNALKENENVKYCALTEGGYMNLQKLVGMRSLPTRGICVNERKLNDNMNRLYVGQSDSVIDMARNACTTQFGQNATPAFSEITYKCYCGKVDGASNIVATSECEAGASEALMKADEERYCRHQFGGTWHNGTCECSNILYDEDRYLCESRFGRPSTVTNASGASATSSGGAEIRPGYCVGKTTDDKMCCVAIGGILTTRIGSFKDCKCGDSWMMSTYDRCVSGNIVRDYYR